LKCMYCSGRRFDLLPLIAEMVHLTQCTFGKYVYILVLLMFLFKYMFSTCYRNVFSLYVGVVRYILTVCHHHMLVIFNLLTIFHT